MSIAKLAVTKPVTMLMFFLAILLLGTVSLRSLPVELMPNIASKKISIVINIRGGMPPTEVETLVTKPVEEAMSTVTNLEIVQSTSEKGRCIVVLKFKPGTDMDFAAMESREKFAKIKNILPKEIERPVIAKYEESDVPILIVAVTAVDPRYTPEVLRKIVDTKIKEAIQRVEGVANIEIGGGREQKILVEVDMNKLQKYNLPLLKVVNSLGVSNLNLMAGEYERATDKFIIRTIGHFQSVEEIRNFPVLTTPTKTIIRLRDIADVKDSFMEAESHARVDKSPVVSLYIQKESTANTIQVCKEVVKALDDLWPKLNDPNIRKIIVSNHADYITEAIDRVKDALLRGADVAILVLLNFLSGIPIVKIIATVCLPITMFIPKVFLFPSIFALLIILVMVRSFHPTLIMAISIPTSILLTFVFMMFRNISINTMTLTGLALALGMLVDNSIVILDNICVHRAKGMLPKNASIGATQEMILPIIASTITTIVVFVPFFFVSEQIKLLYGPMAQTVIFSLIASLFIAITLVPVMLSRVKETPAIVTAGTILHRIYKNLLIKAIRMKYIVFFAPLILLVISLFMAQQLETEFLGTTEESKFTIFVELPDGAKLELSDKVVKAVEALVKKTEPAPDGTEQPLFPEIKTVSSWVKGWSSKVYIELVPKIDRDKDTKEVIESLRPHMKEIEKMAVAPTGEKAFIYFSEPKGVGSSELFVDVYGHDYDKLRKMAYDIAGRMQSIEGLTDVKIRITEGRPELNFKIDKIKAALFSLSVKDVADIVHCQIRGLRATLFHSESREIETIVRLQEKFRRYRKDMAYLNLDTPKQQQIVLDQVTEFVPGMGPSEIWHVNKRRMIQVSGNTGKLPMVLAIEKIKETMKEVELPKDYYWEFGGDYYKMQENRRQLFFCLGFTVLLVYMILASLFESFTQPFIIMITVPLALIGAIFALKITDKPVSMGVIIGGMMLAGIVVNNAIILVDRINVWRDKNYRTLRAIITSGQERLRPILMTTATTVLALLPMAMDRSEAAGLWAPLAITVVGGLAFSTLLTLFIVPIIYTMIEDVKNIFR